MSKSLELIELAKLQLGSYAAVGRAIEKTPQEINHIKTGRHGQKLSLYDAAQLCEVVGWRWEDVAGELLAEHAKSAAEREFWLGKWTGLRAALEKPAASPQP